MLTSCTVIIRQGDKKALCTLTLNQTEYDFWGIKEVVRGKGSSEPITVRTTYCCDSTQFARIGIIAFTCHCHYVHC